jgi:histidinol-phosphate phosphatase family protein
MALGMRQAVILVGGRGTRLGELARDIPKPLVPIGGDHRFLDLLVDDIARHGFEEILLLASHLADAVRHRYGGVTVRAARLHVITEPTPAGTGGALRHAAAALDDVFLMTNGDSLVDVNYLALAAALTEGAAGAIALRRVDDASRYGRIELHGGRVVGFHEKDAAHSGTALVSAGVYVLRKHPVLDLITRVPCSIEADVFPKLAAAGALTAIKSRGFFIDIGLPETLAEARRTLIAQMRRGAVFFDRDGTLIRDSGYTYRSEDLVWQPGAIEAVRRVNDAGRLAIVVTNQSGIARGLYTEEDVRRFHAYMQRELSAHGAHIDAFYYCPFHGDGVVAAYAHANHPDRKPNPGMLRRALGEWPIDAGRTFMIGDTDLDTAAAAAAGLPAFKVRPGELLAAAERGLAASASGARAPDLARALRRCAAGARAFLFEHALPLWWEMGFDHAAGCFHERIAIDGAPMSDLPRRVRVQARQTAVYALAGRLGWNGPWRQAAEAGACVLAERCLRPDGGTRHLLSPKGAPLDERRDLYDAAFVVFALAHAAHALGARPDLIAAAEDLVQWVEATWTHPAGGFREGDLTPTPPRRQNPHMHMFEALLALHEATGRATHLASAKRIAALFQERLFNHSSGALPEYFDDAWRPLAVEEGQICEPGHHFEWSWLLHRYSVLSGERLAPEAERLRVHAEVYGVDHRSGVVFDEVFLDGRRRSTTSRLWPHTERIKANLARYETTRDPAAGLAAVEAFDVLMRFCDVPRKGLWRDRMTQDGSIVDEPARASSFYHVMLALTELIRVAPSSEEGESLLQEPRPS